MQAVLRRATLFPVAKEYGRSLFVCIGYVRRLFVVSEIVVISTTSVRLPFPQPRHNARNNNIGALIRWSRHRLAALQAEIRYRFESGCECC